MTHTTVLSSVNPNASSDLPSKCAECPFFRLHDESGKGWCVAYEQPAREHHLATDECKQVVLVERESFRPTETTHTPTAKQEFAVYLSPVADRYIVHNLSHGTRYIVQYFGYSSGDGCFTCSCPHHNKRSATRGFVDKHIDAVEQALFSKEALTREPIRLQASPLINGNSYAYCGEKYLGYVASVTEANQLADKWFQETRIVHRQNKSVVAV